MAAVFAASAHAQSSPRLRLDSGVVAPRLRNGIQVYARRGKFPPGKVELRLVVRSGTIAERNGEHGFAHLLSHVIADSAAVRRDETVYRLVSDSSERALDAALAVMADWARGRRLDASRVATGKAAVLAELDRPVPAGRRADELSARRRFPDDPRQWRTVLGDRADVGGATRASLARFHRAHYAPDQLAVIAAGDVDPRRSVALIRRHFSTIPSRRMPRDSAPILPAGDSLVVAYKVEPRQRYSGATIDFVFPHHPIRTEADYRVDHATVIHDNMLVYRYLPEWMTDTSCVQMGTPRIEQFHLRGLSAFSYDARSRRPSAIELAISSLGRETRRLRDSGFTRAEFDSVKAAYQRGYAIIHAGAAADSSFRLAEELVGISMGSEPLGLEAEYETARRVIPGITLELLNEMARSMTSAPYRVLTIVVGDGGSPVVPSPREARELFEHEWSAPGPPGPRPMKNCIPTR
jgi:zinc protease